MTVASYVTSPAAAGLSGVGAALPLAVPLASAFGEFGEQDFDRVRRLLEQLCATAAYGAPRAIRRQRVLHLTGVGKSHVYNLMDQKSPSFDPTFPCPFRLGASANAPAVWWEHEVVAWVQSKAAAAEAVRNADGKSAVKRAGATRQRMSGGA